MDNRSYDIALFSHAMQDMIAKSGHSWNEMRDFYRDRKSIKDYTLDEVERIINAGDLINLAKLSRNYFLKDGIYRQLIIYYATLLSYSGLLIPNATSSNQLSNPNIKKRFNAALDYIDKMEVPKLLTNFAIHTLVDGCYYGVIQELTKQSFILIDLPTKYCRSGFKDLYGNDLIEFNVHYFDTIFYQEAREKALSVYPEVISSHYRRWKKGETNSRWVRIPSDIGFCFPFFDDGRPLFVDLIPECMKYDTAVDIERDRELEDIRKILIQKIPHLNDGTLLFEPEEAVEIHAGAVGMMKGNKNISVLTTYADVDAVVSKTSNEAQQNNLDKMYQNIYAKAGTTSQVFAPEGSQAIPYAIRREISTMMVVARKYASFISYIVNTLFSNGSVTFKYEILPLSEMNRSEWITDTLKLADKGYSFLLPTMGFGLSQKEFYNLKLVENDIFKLSDIMVPLKSSYTESNSENEGGAPKKDLEDKSPKTLQNEDAIDNQGGS